MSDVLTHFYAATVTDALYRVQLRQPGQSREHGKARLVRLPVRDSIESGIIGICENLILVTTNQTDELQKTREPAEISSVHRLYTTKHIAALFLDERKSLLCQAARGKHFCDPKWKADTIATLRAIGPDDPLCLISQQPRKCLLPPEEWLHPAPTQ